MAVCVREPGGESGLPSSKAYFDGDDVMDDKSTKFKNRYILGEGYPWAIGISPFFEINLHEGPNIIDERIKLDWPDELWSRGLPRYCLVLERVENE